jgi:hypothetical protein
MYGGEISPCGMTSAEFSKNVPICAKVLPASLFRKFSNSEPVMSDALVVLKMGCYNVRQGDFL